MKTTVPKIDTTASLASLFDQNHDQLGGGFGGGGVLGLRGGMMRNLPSFRRKKLTPPSPPRKEEKQKRPARTPAKETTQDSEEEDNKSVTSEKETPTKSKRNNAIYSSDSEGEESDDEEEAETSAAEDSEDEESEDEKSEDEQSEDEKSEDEKEKLGVEKMEIEKATDDESEDEELRMLAKKGAPLHHDSDTDASRSSTPMPISPPPEEPDTSSLVSAILAKPVPDLPDLPKIDIKPKEPEKQVDEEQKKTKDEAKIEKEKEKAVDEEEEEEEDDESSSSSSSSSSSEEEEEEDEEEDLEGEGKRALSPIEEEEEDPVVKAKSAKDKAHITESKKLETKSPSHNKKLEKIQAREAEKVTALADKKRSLSDDSEVVNIEDDEDSKDAEVIDEEALEREAVEALLAMQDPLDVKVKENIPVVLEPYCALLEHNYFNTAGPPEESEHTDSASEGENNQTLPNEIWKDHNYCSQYYPAEDPSPVKVEERERRLSEHLTKHDNIFDQFAFKEERKTPSRVSAAEKKKIGRPRKDSTQSTASLKDVTNLGSRGSRELASLLPQDVKPVKPTFHKRSLAEELATTYAFLLQGVDPEDIVFLRKKYEELLQQDSLQTYWLNDTHWVEHAHTLRPDPAQPPPKKRRKKHVELDDLPHKLHTTGCARTQGFYKISYAEKCKYLMSSRGVILNDHPDANPEFAEDLDRVKKQASQSREARSETRRIQNVLTSMGEDLGELLKFNQLKFRKKNMKFAKSGIHAWGLFALEPIAAEEMVIEYVGQVVRHKVADIREKQYEAIGIGSSYMFRIDHESVIDATKCGNLARFINHSCNPNCYAKVIQVETQKKIVIYSKREILINEEITYDYKFPLEDVKITCLCGTSSCRGTLN